MKRTFLLSTTLFLTPFLALAAPSNFPELVGLFIFYINLIIPLIIALAVLGFFWGVAQYILASKDTSKIQDARKMILWSLIAIFVMTSVWGILRVLANTFL